MWTDRRTDGRTDMTLIVAFLNFAKAPKNICQVCHDVYVFVFFINLTAILALYNIYSSLIFAIASHFCFYKVGTELWNII
jgi:hypothetical protein